MNSDTHPGTLATLPIDPPSGSGVVYIQVSVNPLTARKGWQSSNNPIIIPIKDLFTMAPYHLVFGVPPSPTQTHPPLPPGRWYNNGNTNPTEVTWDTSNSENNSPAAQRLPENMAVVTNMIGCDTPDAGVAIKTNKMRCIGVTTDFLPYSRDMQIYPNSAARFSIAIAGVVTVACDRNDLCDATVGDTVYYTYEESPMYFEGLDNHRSVKLTTYSEIKTKIDVFFETAPNTDEYPLKREDWLQMKHVLGKLVAFSQHHDECRILLEL
jgi:hypothetical protein